jgi:hypothetical protein
MWLGDSSSKYESPRRHFLLLYMALAWFGEALLYLLFALPFAIDPYISLISFPMPAQAALFGTVWPYFTVAHLAALLTGILLVLLAPKRSAAVSTLFLIYSAINLCGIVTLPFLTPNGQPVYWDYALEYLRLASLVVLAGGVLQARSFDPRVIARCLLIVIAIPIAMVAFTNPIGFLTARGGRVNGPGLEITSSGHVGAMTFLLGLSLPLPRRYKVAMVLLGLAMTVLSGSRIPFLLAIGIAIVWFWKSGRSFKTRAVAMAAVALVAVVVIYFASSSSVGGGRLGTLSGDSSDLENEYAIGRGLAFLTTMMMFGAHPFGYVDSDWAIQQQLLSFGFPSHTHSSVFQSYLRFGPLALIFWIALIWETVKATRNKSPYTACMWFILLGSFADYYDFVTKAMLLVFMVLHLNEAWMASSVRNVAHKEISTRRLSRFFTISRNPGVAG